MDGYSDSAFRRICKEVNPDIVTVTEFTSADGLYHAPNKLRKKLEFHPSEQPVIAQIFGKNVDTFVRATKLCEDMGFSGIDLNMGCPSKRVVRSEHGVALRKNPVLAGQLIEAVANATSLPVSVKTRLGWHDASDLVEFGRMAQSAGADMICIHARTYQVPYKVAPQYKPVYDLKSALNIPVIGNGGITSMADGHRYCHALDGFYIGQATFGNPWIFSLNPPTRFSDRIPVIKNHARYLMDHKGVAVGSREIRKHLLAYVKGIRGAKPYKSQLCNVTSLSHIEDILDSMAHMDYS